MKFQLFADAVQTLAFAAGAEIPEAPKNRWGRPEYDLTDWHEYGGVLIPDDQCEIEYADRRLFAVRTEKSTARFAWGTFAFDVDKVTLDDLANRLVRTGTPWAVTKTPRGAHLHYLGEFWWPHSPAAYAGEWRGKLIRLWRALVQVGIRPDPKHVWGSFLQTRCYVRLDPKPGDTFAFRFIGTFGPLPKPVPKNDYYDPDTRPCPTLALDAVRAMCRACSLKD